MSKSTSFDRTVVLEKCLHVFWKKGYHATSIQNLVDATGLNRSSLYNSFQDKETLFLQILHRYESHQNDLTQDWIGKTTSPKQGVINLFVGILYTILEDPENKGCLLNKTITELGGNHPGINQILTDYRNKMETTIADLIRQAQDAGEISPDKSPVDLATYLFSSLQGLRATALIQTDENELKKVIGLTLSVL